MTPEKWREREKWSLETANKLGLTLREAERWCFYCWLVRTGKLREVEE